MGIIHSLTDVFHRLAHTSVTRGQEGVVIPGILFCRFLDTKAANPRVASLLISERLLVAAEIMGERRGGREQASKDSGNALCSPVASFVTCCAAALHFLLFCIKFELLLAKGLAALALFLLW